ncbi:MAG: FeoA domain-containing protein [Candidatus Comchoanobacterales bacterium]
MEKKTIKDISKVTIELKALLLHHRLVPGVEIICESAQHQTGSVLIRARGERIMLRASELSQIEFEKVG